MAGRLIAVVGPMFSGKSTELVRRLREAQAQGRSVQAVRPLKDTRDVEEKVVTHDGERWPAIRVSSAGHLLERIDAEVDVVGIDEANMYGEGLFDACLALLKRDQTVVVSGLSLDFLGRPFAPVPALMSVAAEVVVVASVCVCCGAPARFSQRLDSSDALIEPGGAELYEPRCLDCFEPASGRC